MPIIINAVASLVAIVTIVNNTHSDIVGLKEKIAELRGQVTTLQSLATITTEQKGDIKALNDRVGKLEGFQATQEQAYNFNFTTRLARVEAKAGIQQSTKKEGD